jgi:hypothetical protein
MLEGSTYNPKWNGNASKYLEGKLKILMDSRGFGIIPTEREMDHLKTLKTQSEIDRAIITIINNRWN